MTYYTWLILKAILYSICSYIIFSILRITINYRLFLGKKLSEQSINKYSDL